MYVPPLWNETNSEKSRSSHSSAAMALLTTGILTSGMSRHPAEKVQGVDHCERRDVPRGPHLRQVNHRASLSRRIKTSPSAHAPCGLSWPCVVRTQTTAQWQDWQAGARP